MNWRNSTQRYGWLSVGLHWLMLALIAAVYALMELRDIYPRGSDPRETMKTWHYMLGLSVLALVALRLVVRLAGSTPSINPEPPGWQKLLAKLTHVALYALMIGMPLVGWLILSAHGDPIPFFGLHLPPLIGEDPDLTDLLKEIHEIGGIVGYFLIGIHAAAGLFHHYFIRDNTLRRMLPGRG